MVFRLKYAVIFTLIFHSFLNAETTVETIWGKVTVSDNLVEKFLNHPVLERMKKVDQSGPLPYLKMMPFFSRYSHSIGVWHLLKIFNRPMKEQLAGLFHDVSHTAFSHIADHLFKVPHQKHSYQDEIHLKFLREHCLDLLEDNEVKKNKITLQDLDPDLVGYEGLEQPLPKLCADRIEYITHTGLLCGLITPEDVQIILKDLRFKDGEWYFVNVRSARILGELSLHFTQNLYGAKWNYVLYHFFERILERSIEIGLIKKEEFLYGTDEKIWKKLKESEDKIIKTLMSKCKNIYISFYVTTGNQYDLSFKTKFRGVNPQIENGKNLILLTDCDSDYKRHFNDVKVFCEIPIRVVLAK